MTFTIIIDSREQKPYKFLKYKTEILALSEGDYSIKGFENEFALERKSLSDFVSSITSGRSRFEKEIIRAKKNLKYFAVIIESNFNDIWNKRLYSRINRAAIINTALFWSVKYNIPFFFVSNRSQGKYAVKTLCEAWMKYKKDGIY